MIGFWIGVLVFLVLVVIGCFGYIVVATWRRGHFPAERGEAEKWATANSVTLDEATHEAAVRYVANSRSLRRIGFVAGIFIPSAVNAGTGIDLHVNGLVWALLGYLIGAFLADVAFIRVPPDGRRLASVSPRRLIEYRPRVMVALELVFLAAVVVSAGAALAGIGGPTGSVTGSVEHTFASTILAAPLALAVVVLVAVVQRRVVLRPQPFADPDLVAADDAMRSSSVRLVGAAGIGIVASLLADQLPYLSKNLERSSLGTALQAIAVAAVLLALASPWLGNRGWRVRRRSTPADHIEGATP